MAATYVPLATTTLGSNTASVNFSSFSGYTDLFLVIQAGASLAGENVAIRFNSDSGNNYSGTELYGDGSTAYSQRYSNQSRIRLDVGPGMNTTVIDNFSAHIMNYANSTTYKTVLSRQNIISGSYPGTGANVGLWRNTNAITTMSVFLASNNNFITNSTFTLYGILAA